MQKGGASMAMRKVDPKAKNLENQAREARNAYAREWRARNRDKIKQYNQNYWTKKAARDGQTATAEGR